MKKNPATHPDAKPSLRPGRAQQWWRKENLAKALNGNPQLDRLFYWKVRGRKSPDGAIWTAQQRREIETGLWLYEFDARISQKYLFGKPAHLLPPERLSSVVAFAEPVSGAAVVYPADPRTQAFSWAWIEAYDKRSAKKSAKLTRAEENGIIAAMKFCLGHFLNK